MKTGVITKETATMVATYIAANGTERDDLKESYKIEGSIEKGCGASIKSAFVLTQALFDGFRPEHAALAANEADKLGWLVLDILMALKGRDGGPECPGTTGVLKALLDSAAVDGRKFSCLCLAARSGADAGMIRALAALGTGAAECLDCMAGNISREAFMAIAKPGLNARQTEVLCRAARRLDAERLGLIADSGLPAGAMEKLAGRACTDSLAPFELKAIIRGGCTERTPGLFAELRAKGMLDRAMLIMEGGYAPALADSFLSEASGLSGEEFESMLRMGDAEAAEKLGSKSRTAA